MKLKVASVLVMLAGAGLGILEAIVSEKSMKETIKEEVAKATSKNE